MELRTPRIGQQTRRKAYTVPLEHVQLLWTQTSVIAIEKPKIIIAITMADLGRDSISVCLTVMTFGYDVNAARSEVGWTVTFRLGLFLYRQGQFHMLKTRHTIRCHSSEYLSSWSSLRNTHLIAGHRPGHRPSSRYPCTTYISFGA